MVEHPRAARGHQLQSRAGKETRAMPESELRLVKRSAEFIAKEKARLLPRRLRGIYVLYNKRDARIDDKVREKYDVLSALGRLRLVDAAVFAAVSCPTQDQDDAARSGRTSPLLLCGTTFATKK
jgi:hypothetical protein